MKMQLYDSDYFARPELSNSQCGQILKSMNHYLYNIGPKSDSINIGKAFHLMILEPDKFEKEVILAPFKDFRTKEAQAWREENKNKVIITSDLMTDLSMMRSSLLLHPRAKNIMGKGESESCYFGEILGKKVRSKIDWINDGIVFDIKTCRDASPDGFSKSIGSYDYHRQASFYLENLKSNGLDVKSFVFIAVENVAPFNTGVYLLDEQSIDAGFQDIKRAINILDRYENSSQEERYAGYSKDIELISIPSWKQYQSFLEAQ